MNAVANEDFLQPGRSFLFASLELLVCVLLSYYPMVAGDLPLGPIFQMKLATKSNVDHQQQMNELILADLKLLSGLINLCTNDQSLQALIPVVLQLLLSTSSVLLNQSSTDSTPILSTIHQFLENIFSTTIEAKILRSTIVTIIQLRSNRTSIEFVRLKIIDRDFISSDSSRHI